MTKTAIKNINDPERRRLSLLIGDDDIRLATFIPGEDASLIYTRIPLSGGAPDNDIALQNTIYDNPQILLPYKSTDILIETKRYLLLPPDKASCAPDILADLYPDTRFETTLDTLDNTGATLAAAVSRQTITFLRRTFTNPRITHCLTPLCRYLCERVRMGNAGKIHLHLAPHRLDIIAIAAQQILMANTFAIDTPQDIVYYTLAAARALNLDVDTDRIILSGDTTHRDATATILRQYTANVMPLNYPVETIRLSDGTPDAPLELLASTI